MMGGGMAGWMRQMIMERWIDERYVGWMDLEMDGQMLCGWMNGSMDDE